MNDDTPRTNAAVYGDPPFYGEFVHVDFARILEKELGAIAATDRARMNKVRSTAERYVYEVESNTAPGKWYRCDLTGNKGAGHCTCQGFAAHRQTAIDEGWTPLTKKTLCEHLKPAFWQFLRDIMPRLAEEEQTEGRAG